MVARVANHTANLVREFFPGTKRKTRAIAIAKTVPAAKQ
jgi:hypothetical protein